MYWCYVSEDRFQSLFDTNVSGQDKYKNIGLISLTLSYYQLKFALDQVKRRRSKIVLPSHSTLCILASSNANLNCFQSIFFYINFYVCFHL